MLRSFWPFFSLYWRKNKQYFSLICVMKYFIPSSLQNVILDNINYIYNWDSGDYIEFDSDDHFFIKSVCDGGGFVDFEASEDVEFLLENNYLFNSKSDYVEWNIKRINSKNENDRRSINLILLPCDQACNFSCLYCYENHSLKSRMGMREQGAILNYIERKCTQEEIEFVSVSYFGGEPLLNKKFIISINEKIIELSGKYNFKFSSSMTTNGYLLDQESAIELCELKVDFYQITIDGNREQHNKLRPLVNGLGTYDRIISNLIAIKESNVNIVIDIRVNFNESNSDDKSVAEFLQFFKLRFGDDSRFRYRFRPIGNYAELNNREVDKQHLCSHIKSNLSQFSMEDKAFRLGLKLSDVSMYSEVGALSCYAGKENSFVISPDLKIKKCTVALDEEMNYVGDLSESGDIVFNKNIGLWDSFNINNHSKCASCHLMSVCTGNSCPLVNIKNKTSVCVPSVSQKNEWSSRFVEILKMED